MRQWMRWFLSPEDCGCGGSSCCGKSADEGVCGCDEAVEEDPVIEIVDPDTGETFSFYYADEFEFEDQDYCVLVTLDEEDPQYVIGRVIEDEDGESFIETLDEEESESIYVAYEDLLEEFFDEDEDEDEDDEDEDEEDEDEEEASELENE